MSQRIGNQQFLKLSVACASLDNSLSLKEEADDNEATSESICTSRSSLSSDEDELHQNGNIYSKRRRRGRETGYASDRSSSWSVSEDSRKPDVSNQKKNTTSLNAPILPNSMRRIKHKFGQRSPALSHSVISQGGKAALDFITEAQPALSIGPDECAVMCEMMGLPQATADSTSPLGTPTALSSMGSPRQALQGHVAAASTAPGLSHLMFQQAKPILAAIDTGLTTSSSDGAFATKGMRVTRSPSKLSWGVPVTATDTYPLRATNEDESLDSPTELLAGVLRKGSGHGFQNDANCHLHASQTYSHLQRKFYPRFDLSATSAHRSDNSPPISLVDSSSPSVLPLFYKCGRKLPAALTKTDIDGSDYSKPKLMGSPSGKMGGGLNLVTYGLNGSMTCDPPRSARSSTAMLMQPRQMAAMTPSNINSSAPSQHRRGPSGGFGSSTTSYVSSATLQREKTRMSEGSRFNINEIIPNELYLCAAKTLVIDPIQVAESLRPHDVSAPQEPSNVCRVCDDLNLTAFLCVADEINEIEIIRPHVHKCYVSHLRSKEAALQNSPQLATNRKTCIHWSQRRGYSADLEGPHLVSSFIPLDSENKAMLSDGENKSQTNMCNDQQQSNPLSNCPQKPHSSISENGSKTSTAREFYGIRGTKTNNEKYTTGPSRVTTVERVYSFPPTDFNSTNPDAGGPAISSSELPSLRSFPTLHVRSSSLGFNEKFLDSRPQVKGCEKDSLPTYTIVSASRLLSPSHLSFAKLPLPPSDTLSQGTNSCLPSPKPPTPSNTRKGFPMNSIGVCTRASSGELTSPTNLANRSSSGHTTPRPHQMLPQIFMNQTEAGNISQGGTGHGTSSSGTQHSNAPLIPILHPVSPRSPEEKMFAATTPLLRICHLPMSDPCDSATFDRLQNEAYSFIELCRSEGRRVVVFCRESKSRSPSTVIAYLMRRYGWSFRKGIQHVRAQCDTTDPNINFCIFLTQLQGRLERQSTTAAVTDEMQQCSPLTINPPKHISHPIYPTSGQGRGLPDLVGGCAVGNSTSTPLSPIMKREDTLLPQSD